VHADVARTVTNVALCKPVLGSISFDLNVTECCQFEHCPFGPRDVGLERTQQKTPFLAAAILHSHAAAGADRTDDTASGSSYNVA
jgi:hypothetical protein